MLVSVGEAIFTLAPFSVRGIILFLLQIDRELRMATCSSKVQKCQSSKSIAPGIQYVAYKECFQNLSIYEIALAKKDK